MCQGNPKDFSPMRHIFTYSGDIDNVDIDRYGTQKENLFCIFFFLGLLAIQVNQHQRPLTDVGGPRGCLCPSKTAGGKNIAGGSPSPGAPSPGPDQRVAVPAPWWRAGLTKGCP